MPDSADLERWPCCGYLISEHGRGGHCPTIKVADTIPVMKLVRWITKCPWCAFVTEELSEPTFARDALRYHLACHFEASDG